MRLKWLVFLLAPALLAACKKHDPAEQAKEDEQIILDYIDTHGLDATATGTGLYYVVDVEGNGGHPAPGATVTVDYRGYFTDGSTFDQSSNAGASFSLNGVIEGWQEGIPLFKEGGSGILLIPSALGYGTSGSGSIPPNTVIIFDVELLDIQ